MDAGKIKGFILYRIYYGNTLVYVGRTKQTLQSRIRGHLFQKPMHRTIFINHVTRIEYAEFPTEANMNLYEIYFINLWKPPLNVDDKCRDELTVELPEVEWKEFTTPLWEKWKEEIERQETARHMRAHEKAAGEELMRRMRRKWHDGEITEEEYYSFKEMQESRTQQEEKGKWIEL